MIRPWTTFRGIVLAAVLVTLSAAQAVHAQGIALSGVGPVNRAMGGASTAAPIDAAGAIHWNPASISGMKRSEMAFGMELLLPTERISSSIEAGALGGGFPPVRLAGSNRGEPGVAPIPTVALVHKSEDSYWTYGLGVFGIAGFRVNYPSSATNPVLMPQNNAPGGFGGLGRTRAEAEYLQIAPTASLALTERLSVGFAPTVTLALLSADPLVFAAPDDADGSGVPTYPPAGGTRRHWGAGFQVGVFYILDDSWRLGFSLKSPQWFESFRCKTEDELGAPRSASVDFDYPMILSLGTAYRGGRDWLLACDVRYFDYRNTDGFGDPAAFAADGRVIGLGWRSVFSIHTGLQYRASDRLHLRLGYQYNDNPIRAGDTFFNSATPLIIQHVVSTGLSWSLTDSLSLSLAYLHGFENRSVGPIVAPGVGGLAGTSVTTETSADALNLGLTVQY